MHIFDEELADRVFLSCCLLWIIGRLSDEESLLLTETEK